MRSATLRLWLAATLILSPASGGAQPAATVSDPEVARGIRHVDDGEYDDAILVLDAAARRLATEREASHVLSQAYLYLGIAYLAKGHETSAKARFRDALAQARDLRVSPDAFAPRVVEMFERAREEMRAAGTTPAASAAPAKKGGGGTLLLVGGGLAAAAGIALAAGGGGSEDAPESSSGGPRQTNFPNEVVVFGGGREFVVTSGGSGTLTARVAWNQEGVLLGMYIVALANAGQVLAEGNQTGTREATLTLPVTAQAYRISVTNSSGTGPVVDTTFTLSVTHP
jgi:hypothetical protein